MTLGRDGGRKGVERKKKVGRKERTEGKERRKALNKEERMEEAGGGGLPLHHPSISVLPAAFLLIGFSPYYTHCSGDSSITLCVSV